MQVRINLPLTEQDLLSLKVTVWLLGPRWVCSQQSPILPVSQHLKKVLELEGSSVESCCTLCVVWTPASVPACRLNTVEVKNLCQRL